MENLSSKASGTPGGEDTKCTASAERAFLFVVINRPVIEYPQQTSGFVNRFRVLPSSVKLRFGFLATRSRNLFSKRPTPGTDPSLPKM